MTVLVREVWTDGRVAQFDCELRGAAGEPLARASINVQSDPVGATLDASALARALGGEAP
ncbi:MAG: hypothetical protein H6713_24085 [Myxococcales bacterium]|nr:hypothetical protein [Myxococcales bacterium]